MSLNTQTQLALASKARARDKLLSEFKLSPKTRNTIENMLQQEPYNMVTFNGQKSPSRKWSCPIERLWSWNNETKNNKFFVPNLVMDGKTYNRRDFISEPIFKTRLEELLKKQIADLGYNRCFFKTIKYTDTYGRPYDTLLVQVPV